MFERRERERKKNWRFNRGRDFREVQKETMKEEQVPTYIPLPYTLSTPLPKEERV